MAEMQPLVGKKGKGNVVVWKHFSFKESDSEQRKILCKMCLHLKGTQPIYLTSKKSTHSVIHDQVVKEQKNSKMKTYHRHTVLN